MQGEGFEGISKGFGIKLHKKYAKIRKRSGWFDFFFFRAKLESMEHDCETTALLLLSCGSVDVLNVSRLPVRGDSCARRHRAVGNFCRGHFPHSEVFRFVFCSPPPRCLAGLWKPLCLMLARSLCVSWTFFNAHLTFSCYLEYVTVPKQQQLDFQNRTSGQIFPVTRYRSFSS